MDLDEAFIQAMGHLDMASDIIARIHDVIGHGKSHVKSLDDGAFNLATQEDEWSMYLADAGVSACWAIEQLQELVDTLEESDWEIVPAWAEPEVA